METKGTNLSFRLESILEVKSILVDSPQTMQNQFKSLESFWLSLNPTHAISSLEAKGANPSFELESILEAKSILIDTPQTYQNQFKPLESLESSPNMQVWY